MGLFGGSTTYVASTIYNLAGEALDRPNYLKTAVLSGSFLGSTQRTISKSVTDAYLTGPGMKLRNFFRWAEDNYGGIGVPTGSLGGSGLLDAEIILPFIPMDDEDNEISIQKAEMGIADFANWTEQWILEHRPEDFGTEYTADIDEVTGFIDIVFEDETEASFLPEGYSQSGVYIYVAYTETIPGTPAIPADPEAEPPVEAVPAVPDETSTKIWIYKMGTGNSVLDTLLIDTVDDGEYIPYIPIRLENLFLSETYRPDSYDLAKKAYKKVSGGNLDDIIDKLKDNPDLGEIDYAYIVFGVPLNIVDNTCRKYLYNFFDRLRLTQTNGNVEWVIYQTAVADGFIVAPPENVVHIRSNGSLNTNLDLKITWNSISRNVGAGPGRLGAIAGDYWIEGATVYAQTNVVRIWYQVTDNSWERLTVIGAVHDNLIYKNKSVTITAKEALADTDESGFVVPIHYATMRDMGLKDSTQLSTQCTILVLNSYKVVKKKWYQTGIFKIFAFVVLIAATIAFAPAGGTLLASYASIGAVVGLTGLMGIIAGAVVSAIATMLIMKIIGKISVAIFGEQFGAIIAAVAAFATMQVASGLAMGNSLSSMWGTMMSAPNLISLTMAVGNGVAGYVQASAMQTMEKTQELITDYEKESAELSQKFADQFGSDKALLDPLGLVDANIGNAMETEFQFLSRTLMTGTDIAELSKDMLNNFTKYTLSLDPSQGMGG